MHTTPEQPDQAWWDAMDPAVEAELESKRLRALADIQAGRLTSADDVRAETRAFFKQKKADGSPDA